MRKRNRDFSEAEFPFTCPSLTDLSSTTSRPEFAKYILDQNKANAGENINIVALGINNGWFDAKIQEPAYATYLYNNSHRPLIDESQYTSYINAFNTACLPDLNSCASSGSDSACSSASDACYNAIEGPLSQVGDFDVYDIRAPSNDPQPPETYINYLTSSAVVKAIGAKSTYQECSNSAGSKFSPSGDSECILFHHRIHPFNLPST